MPSQRGEEEVFHVEMILQNKGGQRSHGKFRELKAVIIWVKQEGLSGSYIGKRQEPDYRRSTMPS